MNEIVKANPKYRTILIFIAIGVIVFLFAVVMWGGPWFRHYINSMVEQNRMDDLKRAMMYLEIAMVAIIAVFSVFGAKFVIMGKRTIRERRFPPTGVRVIRDTEIVIEEDALSRGRLVSRLGYVLIITSVVTIVVIVMLFQNLFTMMQ